MSDLRNFLHWFRSQPQNGCIDIYAIEFRDIPGSGRGAFASRDMPADYVLFTIPRKLTLSTRTSTLPEIFGDEAWKSFGLHKGWAGLILCMLFEESLGLESKWYHYLASLPTTFDTPMFWNEEDLAELTGTAIVGKIGKADADRDFHEKVVPAIQSRPDIFSPETLDRWYTLERYHIMGSNILSRSFQIETEQEHQSDQEGDGEAKTSSNSAMDVDETEESDKMEAESDDEEGDVSAITMVPVADLLNACYGCNNARLFDEDPDVLTMTTTKPIKEGEQIWNTYGDLPNSELLRRYGHVDMVELPGGSEGNPADVVEVPATLVVSTMLSNASGSNWQHLNETTCKERIDWWLDEAGDDTFVVEMDLEIPPPLIILVRLLLLCPRDWETTKSKQKLPRPKLDGTDSADLLMVVRLTLQTRLIKEYKTTFEDDQYTLTKPGLSRNKRNAIIVRLGEKKILRGLLLKVMDIIESKRRRPTNTKRKSTDDERVKAKRSKR